MICSAALDQLNLICRTPYYRASLVITTWISLVLQLILTRAAAAASGSGCSSIDGNSISTAQICGAGYPNFNVSYPFGFDSNISSSSSCTGYDISGLPEFRLLCSPSVILWSPVEPNSSRTDMNASLNASIINITSNNVNSGSFVVGYPNTSGNVVSCNNYTSTYPAAMSLLSSVSNSFGPSFQLYKNVVLFPNCSRSGSADNSSLGLRNASVNCQSLFGSALCNQSGYNYTNCIEAPGYSRYTNNSIADLVSQARSTYGCSDEVVILYEVPKSAASSTSSMTATLQLSWTIEQSYYDCKVCQGSNGTCGMDNATESFQCTCPAGNRNSTSGANVCAGNGTTPSTSSKNNLFPISIGVIATAVAMLIVCSGVGGYCFWSKSHGGARYETERLRRLLSTQMSSNCCKHHVRKNQMLGMAAAGGDRAGAGGMSILGKSFQDCSSRVFSYEELMEATDGFSDSRLIGDGGFGMVYEGRIVMVEEKIGKDDNHDEPSNSRRVAVKRLFSDNNRRMEQFLNEIRILSAVRHPNLVRLYGFCCETNFNELLLVYEFAANGTLADNVHGAAGKGLLWETRLSIALETALALAYLHKREPPIVHRDVKSSNILLDDSLHAKLGDFGLSRRGAAAGLFESHVSTAPQGTPGYVDPQYHQSYQLTEKSDVYSFGVVLMELITGKLPVDMLRQQTDINLSSLAVSKIQTGALEEIIDPFLEVERFPLVKDTVTRVAELALQCLAPFKDDRPGMDTVARVLHDIARAAGYVLSVDSSSHDDSTATSFAKRRQKQLGHHDSDSSSATAPSRDDDTAVYDTP